MAHRETGPRPENSAVGLLKFILPNKTHSYLFLYMLQSNGARSVRFTQHTFDIRASLFHFSVLYCVQATLLSGTALSGIGLSVQEEHSM